MQDPIALFEIDPDDRIGPREAAKEFNLGSPRTIANYRDRGLLKYARLNSRKYIYSRAQCREVLKSHTIPATPTPQLHFFDA